MYINGMYDFFLQQFKSVPLNLVLNIQEIFFENQSTKETE